MDRGFKGSYVRLYALTSLRWHTWKGLAQWPGTGRTKSALLLTRGVLGPDLAGCEAHEQRTKRERLVEEREHEI